MVRINTDRNNSYSFVQIRKSVTSIRYIIKKINIEVDKILKDARLKMEDSLRIFERDLAAIRTGRASAMLVENILVEVYNSKMPLKGLATISVPEATSIVVVPFDKNNISAIEQAIRESDLGINPVNTGLNLRLVFPPMTEERRKELSKIVFDKAEETRISLRLLRKEAWDKARAIPSVTEDDKYWVEEHLNRLIEEFNGKIEELAGRKEGELMRI